MIVRESGPVAPLLAYALAVQVGVEPESVLVPFLLCEAAGIVLYVVELRHRYRRRHGRR